MAAPVITSFSVGAGQPINGGRWPGGRLASALGLGDVLPAGAMASNAAALAGGVGLHDAVADGGLRGPQPPVMLLADGITTWFTDPRSTVRNGHQVSNVVDSIGRPVIARTRLSDLATTSYALSAIEVDDHDNGSHIYEPVTGRLIWFFGAHNDSVFRYAVASLPEDISAWSAVQQRGTGGGPYSYPKPHFFPNYPGRLFFFYRQGGGGGPSVMLAYRTCDDILTVPATTWSAQVNVFSVPGKTPYSVFYWDGNTVHVFITDMHPVQGQSSLYYFRMEMGVDQVLRYYRADGTQITAALPFGPADCSLVYDGSTTRCWVMDATVDSAGHPRVLYTRYPGNDGSAIEYWQARWNGGAFVLTKVCDDGPGLYSPEVYYPGTACYNSQDANELGLSAPIGGVRQIQVWRSVDGDAYSFERAITSGGSAGNPLRFRVYSPRNHNGVLPYQWCEGDYSTFTAYLTALMGGG